MRILWTVALLGACAGNGGEDTGTSGLSAPEVTTSPAETARSDQDVSPVILAESEGAESYTYTWISDDGASWPQEILPATATVKNETWTLTVTPRAGAASGDSGTATVAITNGPPRLSSAEFTPSTPTVGTDLTCIPVGAEDPDDDTITFSYAWERAGSALTVTSNTLPGSEVVAGASITCIITPNDGEVDGEPREITGSATNSPPTSTGSAITPTNPRSTDDLTCTGSGGTDPDGEAVTFPTSEWYVNGVLQSGTSNTLSASAIAKGDVINCTAVPYDGAANGTGTPSPNTTVGNGIPTISQVLISPTAPVADDTISCTPTGTDPDNDTLTWTYEWRLGTTLLTESSDFLVPPHGAPGDTLTCTAIANDGTDTASLESSAVTFQNSPPTVSGVAITPSSAHGREALTCSYTSLSDPDGQTPTATFAWTVDGNAAGTGATLPADSGNEGDLVVCAVTPNDGFVDGTPGTAQLTFGNAPPDTPSVSISPTSGNSETSFSCSASPATDWDGDSVTYSYRWLLGGSEIATGASLSPGVYFRDDAVSCQATPNDGTVDGTAGTASVTIGNTAPTASTPSLSTPVYEATSLVCASTLDDVDGDSPTAAYRWTVAGSDVAFTSGTLTGTYFNKDQTVRCHVTPSDDLDSGTEVSSNTITVQNTAPTAPQVRLSTTSAVANSTDLRCDLAATGDDDDPADASNLTYEFTWLRNGSTYTGATTSTNHPGDTIPAASLDTGTYQCSGRTVDLDGATSPFDTSGTATVSPGTQAIRVAVQIVATANGQWVVDQLNDDTYYDFDATLVTDITLLDSAVELSNYDVLILLRDTGAAAYSDAFATAVRDWVQGGGGVITTGWFNWHVSAQSYAATMDQFSPIVISGTQGGYCYGSPVSVTVTNPTHPIMSGVSSFSYPTLTYSTHSDAAPDAGSVLATQNGTTSCTTTTRNHIVAGTLGSGRTVYIGALYGINSEASYQNQDLSSGVPDRILEQAANWAAN